MKKVIVLYGGWSLAWVVLAMSGAVFAGHGEFGIAAHFILALTGSPLALFSLEVVPHGSVLCVAIAGFLGTVQWLPVAEINQRWERWKNGRKQGL